VKLGSDRNVEVVVLMGNGNISDRQNFGRFKRINKKVYVEEEPEVPEF
jgi:hypothetical protein